MHQDFLSIQRLFQIDLSFFTPDLISDYEFNLSNIQNRFVKIESKRKFVLHTYEIKFANPFLDLFSSCQVEFHEERDGVTEKMTVQFITKDLNTKKATIILETFVKSIYTYFGVPINIADEPIPIDKIFDYISSYYLVLFHWKASACDIVIGKREGRSFAIGFYSTQ
jgi:hypothetical protein